MPLQHVHRPTDWDEVRGNEKEINSLRGAVEREDEKPHVYLIIGPAGTGKTTLARIIRQTLECDDMNYRIIEPGKGGVEMVRELKRTVRLKPSGKGKVRVWHSEEAHRLTSAAQEDILTLLEEPPEHAYFTFATTEPGKLTAAFLRRCHVVTLKPLDDEEIETLCSDIWEKEFDDEPPEGLFEAIVVNALGSPGMALKLLDEVIDLEDDEMAEAVARKAAEQSQSIELCRQLIGKVGWKQIATTLKQLKGEDPESIRRHVMGYAQSIMLSGADHAKAGLILIEFRDHPTYDSGWPGLVATCYDIVAG